MRRASWRWAVGLALAVMACTSPEQEFQQHLEQAEGYLRAEKPREALVELRYALQLRPNDAQVNFRIAEVLNGRRQLAEAVFFYGEASRLDPSNLEATLALALLLRFDEPKRARELVEQLVAEHPESPLGYIGRANVALAANDTKEALEAALTAVELAPEHPEAYATVGMVHQARIREARLARTRPDASIFEAAIAAFEHAHQFRDPSSKWRDTLERAHTLATWPGHAREAPGVYAEAVDEAHETGVPSFERAALLRSLDFSRETENAQLRKILLDRLIELNPGDDASWAELARLEEEQGGSAEEVLSRLIEARPEDPMGYVLMSGHLFEQGRLEEAAKYLQERADEGIAPAVLLGQLSRMYFQERRIQDARAVVERLERDHPDDPATAMAYAQLAVAEARPKDAVKRLETLSERGIENVEVLRLLAEARHRAGDLDGAKEAVDRARELAGGRNAGLERLRLRVQADSGDCVGALRTLRGLRRLDQVELAQQLNVAGCFYAAGDADAGRELLEPLVSVEAPPLPVVLVYAVREGRRSPERVRTLLEATLARRPGDSLVLYQLAALALQSREPEAALGYLDRALADGSDQPRLLLARARVRLALDDLAGAREDALAAYEADPEIEGSLALVVGIDRAEGRHQEALARLEEVERQGRLTPTRRKLLAHLYMDLHDHAQAREQYERLVVDNPKDARAKNDLAFLLAEANEDLERATQLAEEAQRRLGDSPLVADTLGFVYLRRGLGDPALKQFEYAIKLAEAQALEKPDLFYHRGLALQALGRSREAGEAFEKALSIDADFPEADLARRELEAVRAADAGPAS